MEAFSRGWNFLKQAWQMAFKDRDLLKPSLYALVVGAVVSVIGVIPIIGVAFVAGESEFANIILFVMSAILIFVQFIVSYIFSAMTVYLIYQYLTKGDGKMGDAWAIVKRDFFDILTLAAASTVVNLIKNAANRNKKGSIGAAVARAGAGLLDTLWTEAALLILPAMVIDDLNLKKGMERIWQITKSNLLLIGISTVGVKWVTGLIGFVLGVIGAVIGFAIGGGAAYASGDPTIIAIGIGVGVMIFFFFVMLASFVTTYTSTAYHTCLYIWAREVEEAKEKGKSFDKIAAPAPLAAVLK